MSTANWLPRRWNAELSGCIWLPRLLDKGRQVLLSRQHRKDLMNGYLFGDFDYADRQLIKFLRTNDAHVLSLLSDMGDDEAVATALIRESGRSPEEIQAWSKRFRTLNAPFIPMWDADEGRRKPGIGTWLLDKFYNYLMMPPVYVGFRIAERLRQRDRA